LRNNTTLVDLTIRYTNLPDDILENLSQSLQESIVDFLVIFRCYLERLDPLATLIENSPKLNTLCIDEITLRASSDIQKIWRAINKSKSLRKLYLEEIPIENLHLDVLGDVIASERNPLTSLGISSDKETDDYSVFLGKIAPNKTLQNLTLGRTNINENARAVGRFLMENNFIKGITIQPSYFSYENHVNTLINGITRSNSLRRINIKCSLNNYPIDELIINKLEEYDNRNIHSVDLYSIGNKKEMIYEEFIYPPNPEELLERLVPIVNRNWALYNRRLHVAKWRSVINMNRRRKN
jgi:hypothetical protein